MNTNTIRIFLFSAFTLLSGCMLDEIARSGSAAGPTPAEVSAAVKQALEQGIRQSITTLGRYDGFYANSLVHIPVPEDLQKAEKLLRKLGQGKYADRFVLSLNRAAEQAVPEAMGLLTDAVRHMTIQDAVAIVRGPDTAATDYFRKTSSVALASRFKPIVSTATAATGVTKGYKEMLQKAGFAESLLSPEARDLDAYVAAHAVDALFLYIAAEESKIRQDPLNGSTQLLRKVFGYYLG